MLLMAMIHKAHWFCPSHGFRLTACCVRTGLVNSKTVDISADGEAVKLSLARTKNAAKPKASKASSSMKKNARRVLKAVGKQVASYRPDLKVCKAAGSAAHRKQ